MMDSLYYLVPLLVTIAVEVAVAVLLGFRRRNELAAVALVTVFTFPILSLILAAFTLSDLDRGWYLAALLALETAVVLAEWKLLAYALRREQRVLLISATMNAASFLVGLFLLRMF